MVINFNSTVETEEGVIECSEANAFKGQVYTTFFFSFNTACNIASSASNGGWNYKSQQKFLHQ